MATMETTPVHGHAVWVLTAYQTHGTPASAPVVIKLGYTVMHILEGQVVEEPPVPTSFSSLGDFLHQASRRRAISTVLLTAGVYGYDICFAERLRQLVAFCNYPVETALNSGNGFDMIVDVLWPTSRSMRNLLRTSKASARTGISAASRRRRMR
ncbi:unnamed protein product [Musa acuminata subsp. burmannicoides]